MDPLVVHRSIRKRTGKEYLLQLNLSSANDSSQKSESKRVNSSVLGYSEGRVVSLPRPCLPCLAPCALWCSAVHVHRWMMTSMWAKVSLYIHIFPKRKQGLHVFCGDFFFFGSDSESVLLGIGSPPDEFEGGQGEHVHNIHLETRGWRHRTSG